MRRKGSAERGTVLRGKGILEAGLHLNCGEARGIPAATKRLDQKNGSDELLTLDDGHFALVVEEIFLGVDDVEIADQAADVTAIGNFEGATGGVHGLLLRFLGFVEYGEAGDAVLNFPKCVEHGVAIAGDGSVVAGLDELQLGAASAAGKYGLRDVCAKRPESALDVSERRDVLRLPAATGEEIEGRKISRLGDTDLGIGGGHLALGFSNVGAAFQKIGRKAGVNGRGFRA